MEREEIFAIIKQNIIEIVPELANHSIMMTDSLRELGANSIDRAEILIKSMASLKLKIPLVDLGQAKNIEALVDIFANNLKNK